MKALFVFCIDEKTTASYNKHMTLQLEMKPQLSQKLLELAKAQGVSLQEFIADDLESRFLLPNGVVFKSLGIGENDLTGEDSEAWLLQHWNNP
jgi:lipoprotein NlpI